MLLNGRGDYARCMFGRHRRLMYFVRPAALWHFAREFVAHASA